MNNPFEGGNPYFAGPEYKGSLTMKFARLAALALCLGVALPLGGCDKIAPAGQDAQQAEPAGLAGVRAAIVARNFGEAVELAAAEVKVHPNDPSSFFEQARAEALAGNESRALDALDRAITLGLPDAARALDNPAFEQISSSERFVRLVDRAIPSTAGGEGTTIAAGRRRDNPNDGVVLHEKPGGGTHIQAGDVVLDTDF